MKEIIIPLISGFVGTIVGSVTSFITLNMQLKVENRKVKIELLYSQLEKFEKIQSQISIPINVPGKITEEILGSIHISNFGRFVNLIKPYSHYFQEELIEKMLEVNNNISGFIVVTKMGKPLDEVSAIKELEAMKEVQIKLEKYVSIMLRDWSLQINKIMKL